MRPLACNAVDHAQHLHHMTPLTMLLLRSSHMHIFPQIPYLVFALGRLGHVTEEADCRVVFIKHSLQALQLTPMTAPGVQVTAGPLR